MARLNMVRELGRGSRFARAVNADNRNDGDSAILFAQFSLSGCQTLFNLLFRNAKNIQPGRTLCLVGFLHRLDYLSGHLHAEIGADKGGFEFFKGCSVQSRRASDYAFDFVGQLALGFLQAGPELGEKTHFAEWTTAADLRSATLALSFSTC